MAINFIIPDLMLQAQTKGLKALGLDIDAEEICKEMEALYNTSRQRSVVEGLYAGVIPPDLPVCIINEADSGAICRRYGIPEGGRSVAAAVVPGLDSRHQMVLLLIEEYMMDRQTVNHELVHYRQIKEGRLVTHPGGGLFSWTVPGEEYTIDSAEDAVYTFHLPKGGDDFLWHELQKPWELEAYALTTPANIVREKFSERCQRKIREFLERRGL